jgi:hypothetical protein
MISQVVAFSYLMAVLCGPTTHVEAGLSALGEIAVGEGVTLLEEPFKIYSNPSTGAFTVIVRKANGLSCLIAAGEDYRKLKGPTNETYH